MLPIDYIPCCVKYSKFILMAYNFVLASDYCVTIQLSHQLMLYCRMTTGLYSTVIVVWGRLCASTYSFVYHPVVSLIS